MIRVSLLLLITSIAACSSEQEISISSTKQFVTVEEGRYQFFIGDQVPSQIEETGSYVPKTTDWYSVISLPVEQVTTKVLSEPITLSLCNAANGVRLFDHVYVGPDRIEEYVPTDGTTHITGTPEGELLQNYASGDEGVYGLVQIAQLDDGSLVAAAAAEFYIPFPNEPGGGSGGMLLGIPVGADPNIEDPLADSPACTAPSEPPW